MDIEQHLHYLFNLERANIKYDLNNIDLLCNALGNPHRKFKSIHIAGTNGKGSVAAMTASFLTEAGFKTGLYMSPHVLKFNERISVNGVLVEDEFIRDFLDNHKQLFNEVKPSFFEATTAMAFAYFGANEIDFAVLETGLGGRLDATNIIQPVLTAITTIGLDHAEYLGETTESVAKEKAGIIKKNIPCVTGEIHGDALKVIENTCEEQNSLLFRASAETEITRKNEYVVSIRIGDEQYDDIHFPFTCKFQLQNFKTALSIFAHIFGPERINISKELIQNSLLRVVKLPSFRGRFETINNSPQIIVDVAHNPQALHVLRESIEEMKYEKLVIVFGVMEDKDIKSCVDELLRFDADKFILTKANIHRSFEPSELVKFFPEESQCITTFNLLEAYSEAVKILENEDLLLVTGSFYVVGDFLSAFNQYKLSR